MLAVFGAACACPVRAAAGNGAAPGQIWGIEATNAFTSALTVKRARSLRAGGLNTIIVERRRVSATSLARLARVARAARLTLVSAGPPPAGRSRVSSCTPRGAVCGVVTRSPRTGLQLARRRIAATVIVRVGGPAGLQALAGRTVGSRVIALLPLRHAAVDDPLWRAAIASARRHRGLDLAVALVGADSDAALETFLTLLRPPPTGGGSDDDADVLPPTAPLALAVHELRSDSISATWPAASDNVGVVGYELLRDGARAGSVTGTTHTFTGLACGTAYTLAVVAFDAAGNRSPQTVVVASTSVCGGGGGGTGPPADTTPPTVPTNLAAGSAAGTVPLSWDPADDAIGVAGYTVYRDGAPAGDTTSAALVAVVPACDQSYGFAVDAYDASGNRSARTPAITVVYPCPASMLDSGPTGTVTSTSASFFFSSPAPHATFECSVDGTAFVACSSPASLSGLAEGAHVFRVRARDPAGNVDASPAERTWVINAASVFVSASGSDAAACTVTAPCRSFERAYRAADPGDIVELAAGSYGEQTVTPDATKTSTGVVIFRPAPGATAVTGDLNVSAAHVEFRNLTMESGSLNVHSPANDVTLRDSVATDGGLFVFGGSNISIIGGSFGPGVDFHSQIAPWPENTPISNVLIDGVTFHDWRRSGPGVHTECLQVAAGNGITIRNSRFRNCDVFDLTFTMYLTDEPPTNITLENNFFDVVDDGFFAVWFQADATAWSNVLVRNNSTLEDIAIDAGPPLTNVRFVNNLGALNQASCHPQVTYRHNVWDGAACGPSDRNAPSGFVDAAGFDLHLAAGSAAIDAGDPTDHPATDVDGQSRPLGSGPDAGADEAG